MFVMITVTQNTRKKENGKEETVFFV